MSGISGKASFDVKYNDEKYEFATEIPEKSSPDNPLEVSLTPEGKEPVLSLEYGDEDNFEISASLPTMFGQEGGFQIGNFSLELKKGAVKAQEDNENNQSKKISEHEDTDKKDEKTDQDDTGKKEDDEAA
ncbi:hypothetical protein [Vibrio owensii]|uniref:Uncharacterized protein n=1 Tax=Vibrio owensii CAIM 1854 = LMG 25443 TaxID=1229493 RepID=A0A0C1WD69_9VIBR|nr:hypothetical protein [Vibrio owensii]KIF54302.1 hypothetical protein H735_04450 [Vibrio owensii CAIM 1854 = LMG 25443]